jgi:hypothetical protein
MDEMKENVVFSTEANAEYVHLIEDVNVWFIDYVIGVAFRTPINFADKMNGLRESGRPYREFSDYKQKSTTTLLRTIRSCCASCT